MEPRPALIKEHFSVVQTLPVLFPCCLLPILSPECFNSMKNLMTHWPVIKAAVRLTMETVEFEFVDEGDYAAKGSHTCCMCYVLHNSRGHHSHCVASQKWWLKKAL